jgi:hypothetical protein
MARTTRQTETDQQPTFIFRGTIKKLKSATMKEVPVNERTAIVKVDQIIEAPSDLTGYNGVDVTVQLSGGRKFSVGQQMIFHTTSWMYGAGVAVKSLSEEPLKIGDVTKLSAGGDPVERRARREQRKTFDAADLVVSGKVLEVRLPVQAASGKRASKTSPGPISEHDPKWREAVIEVGQVHKGALKKKKVVVPFPSSTDVMWHGTPKLHAGQEGVFLLHKTKAEKLTRKKAAAGSPEIYAALGPGDFQPQSESGGIRNLFESKVTKSKS